MSDLGVVLVVVGVALMVAEAHLPSHAVLATGAVAAP
jgi:membrane-bound ClpP family serine protease